jgi:hypothetical protein
MSADPGRSRRVLCDRCGVEIGTVRVYDYPNDEAEADLRENDEYGGELDGELLCRWCLDLAERLRREAITDCCADCGEQPMCDGPDNPVPGGACDIGDEDDEDGGYGYEEEADE